MDAARLAGQACDLTLRAAICVRVSPRPQDKVKYSPKIQERKCREWCDANGHEVVTVIRDILVSGGDPRRFQSIFDALDNNAVELFVVSDLSRWTRDEPEVYWSVKARLAAHGVQLHSVDEPFLTNEDVPFRATIQTMLVEMNAQERQRLRQKTSAGIRAAKASGRYWWHPFGWKWNSETRSYMHDTDRINELYQMWVNGATAGAIGRRLGIRASHVRRAINAEGQRAIVGDVLWLRAQQRDPGRGPRNDTQRGNVYRGLLVCPFCGKNIQRHASERQPWAYRCVESRNVPHGWRQLSAKIYVTPVVQDALSRLVVPVEEIEAMSHRSDNKVLTVNSMLRDYAAEIERLTMAWSKGRLSDERYERAVTAIEQERDRPIVPRIVPVPVQVEIARFAEQVDLETQDIDEANALNAVLREALDIQIGPDRHARVAIREPYSAWAK